jgi:DNA mismatch repair protein MutL
VIERPASVVRELLDDAIDAGATEIGVELRGGGLELIRVTDDGCGIPPDEVALAFERHATSKLRSEADLLDLASLGFRGEALPSIAAVAEVTMLTRSDAAQRGVAIELRGGSIVRRAPAARQRGSTVSVRHLFRNVPARLKFLPAGRTESLVVGQLVRRAALAHTGLRLSLVLDGHLSFRSGGSSDLRTAVAEVYGDALAECMLPLAAPEPGTATVSGLLSGRTATRPSRTHITLIVNGRVVTNAELLTALEAAYRPFLPRGRHPIAVIRLEIPAADVDPNVHPAKSEVRLARQCDVGELLARTVRETLTSAPAALDAGADFTLIGGQPRLALRPRRVRETPASLWPATGSAGAAAGIPVSELRVIAQVQGALILAEGPGGLYLVDQHRAHERAIFERLLRREGDADADAQALLDPILVELPRHRAARLEERLPALARLGFALERFGDRYFLVRAIPAPIASGEAPELSEILDEAAAEGESWRQRLLIALSCRCAIRRNQPLGPSQMQGLLADLAETAVPAACPHGSPLVLHVGRDFLERQFGW